MLHPGELIPAFQVPQNLDYMTIKSVDREAYTRPDVVEKKNPPEESAVKKKMIQPQGFQVASQTALQAQSRCVAKSPPNFSGSRILGAARMALDLN